MASQSPYAGYAATKLQASTTEFRPVTVAGDSSRGASDGIHIFVKYI